MSVIGRNKICPIVQYCTCKICGGLYNNDKNKKTEQKTELLCLYLHDCVYIYMIRPCFVANLSFDSQP